MKKWSDEEMLYLKNNYLNLGCEECSNVLNRSKSSIKSKAITMNLFLNKWSERETNILLENYGKITNKNLLKLLKNRTYNSITAKAIKLNLKSDRSTLFQLKERKNKFNETYFEKINIFNSYWAGFIAADGNIFKNSISIKLSKKDHDHLQKLKYSLNFESNITTINIGKYEYSKLNFYSKKTVEDLKTNFNIIPKKSLILKPPVDINIDCAIAFICGLLDGDGSIFYNTKKTKIYMKFLGTKEILEWTKEKLSNYINIKKCSINKNRNIYSLCIHQKQEIIKIFNIINKCELPLLNRKWEKLKNYI